LGAGQLQIMALLVAEALLLSSIGGLLGLGLGFAGSWITVQFYPTLQTTPPPWAIAAALGTALTTGFVFSLLPARRAARLDPIEALARH